MQAVPCPQGVYTPLLVSGSMQMVHRISSDFFTSSSVARFGSCCSSERFSSLVFRFLSHRSSCSSRSFISAFFRFFFLFLLALEGNPRGFCHLFFFVFFRMMSAPLLFFGFRKIPDGRKEATHIRMIPYRRVVNRREASSTALRPSASLSSSSSPSSERRRSRANSLEDRFLRPAEEESSSGL